MQITVVEATDAADAQAKKDELNFITEDGDEFSSGNIVTSEDPAVPGNPDALASSNEGQIFLGTEDHINSTQGGVGWFAANNVPNTPEEQTNLYESASSHEIAHTLGLGQDHAGGGGIKGLQTVGVTTGSGTGARSPSKPQRTVKIQSFTRETVGTLIDRHLSGASRYLRRRAQ